MKNLCLWQRCRDLNTSRNRKIFGFCSALVIFLGVSALLFSGVFDSLTNFVASHMLLGALVYVGFLAFSVVLLPLSSLPLLPIAAASWGVFLGGLLSAFGWWLGALGAFLLARHLGRPALECFVSLRKVDSLQEKFPEDATFFTIVLLRMATPVEVPSFALGLMSGLSFWVYACASLLGILPFSFLLVFCGGVFVSGEWLLLFGVSALIVLLVFFLRRLFLLFFQKEREK